MSPITCYLSPVTSHQSPVNCHLSPITYHLSPITCHLSPVTSHKTRVTFHLSSVTCHLLVVICHLSLWGVELGHGRAVTCQGAEFLQYKGIIRVRENMLIFQHCLLRRLQAQTLPHATPPIGQIHPFSKMAVTFEPQMGF